MTKRIPIFTLPTGASSHREAVGFVYLQEDINLAKLDAALIPEITLNYKEPSTGRIADKVHSLLLIQRELVDTRKRNK